MAHECPDCGETCYCDGEDTFFDFAPSNCRHILRCCDESGFADYEGEFEEDDED